MVVSPASRFTVLWQPRAAFAALQQRPRLWLTLVVVLAVASLPAVAFVATQNIEQHIKREMKLSGAWEKLPADLRDRTLVTTAAISTVGMPVGAAAMRGIAVLATALLCFLFAGQAQQQPSVAAVGSAAALAQAPLMVRDVLQAIMMASSRELTMAQNPLLSSPTGLLSDDQARSWWGVLLGGLDVFSIWTILLVGIGMHVVTGAPRRLFVMAAVLVAVGMLVPGLVTAWMR
jgi:hypothetical protein